jgi:hypothetical protein
MKELRDAMRHEAGWVWREMARAASLGVFLNEETITETILLRLAVAAQGNGFLVFPFTKPEEKKNGADWEFWFGFGRKLIGLRVQAKRLYPSGRYDSLEPTGTQIDNLIAQAHNCVPVFVFYNDAENFRQQLIECRCSEYRSPSYNGCVVARAEEVKKVGSNDPRQMLDFSIPWHCMLCNSEDRIVIGYLGIENNLPYLLGLSEIAEGVRGEDYTSDMENRIRELGARAREKTSSEPDWLDWYLRERKLAGLALFSAREMTPE